MRKSFDVLLLPGDGIGPEVVGAAREVVDAAAEHFGIEVRYEERRIGGTAIREEGEPVSAETLEAAGASDSVLLGAVGHPDFDDAPVRPEAGLLEAQEEPRGLRQPEARGRYSGAHRFLAPQARGRRWRRRAHRQGADRRGLLRGEGRG